MRSDKESIFYRSGDVDRLHLNKDDAETLVKIGIPSTFFDELFRACDSLQMLDTARGRLVKIGSSSFDCAICLEPESRMILHFASPDDRGTMVNATIRQFVDTIRMVESMFPFHSTDATDDEISAAADDLRSRIREIDPLATNPDQFWSELVESVRMGDFDVDVMAINDKVLENRFVDARNDSWHSRTTVPVHE